MLGDSASYLHQYGEEKTYLQHIENNLEIPHEESLERAKLTCLLPQSNILMAIAGSNHQLTTAHQLFNNMSLRRHPPVQRSNPNNNHQGNGQQQQDAQNNGNNSNGNRNRNNHDNKNNNDQRPPTDNDRRDGPIEGVMTKERKNQLKGFGFLVVAGRLITFVHKFSGHNNKGMCNHFAYKGATYSRTDNGTCRFAHIKSFWNLPTGDKNTHIAWLRDTPDVFFADGQGPTNSG